MARKSRKENIQNISVEIKNVETTFSCGIYGRLSLVNSGKQDDGDSIENQISICTYFIKEHPELKLKETYIDNGRKGTNFDRPEFNRMMDDVRSGKINCIIVKDLSRFGRDYLEAGEYIEKIFPFLNVRFIAVTDGFDSFHSSVDEQTLTVPLKNVINELYAKDLSRKICTSIHARMEKGQFLPGRLCYGYLRSDTEDYRLIPDPFTAPIVKLIFELRLQGLSYEGIRKHLDQIHAITPSQRKAQLEDSASKQRVTEYWYATTVKDCLGNLVYLGHLVYGKQPTALYKGQRKTKEAPMHEWKIIRNVHEPLVTQEQFDQVQKMNRESEQRYRDRHSHTPEYQNIYAGIIKCGDCGKEMLHGSHYCGGVKISKFKCGGYLRSHRRVCSLHSVREADLNRVLMEQVKMQSLYLQSQLSEREKQDMPSRSYPEKALSELTRQRTRVKKLRESLYMNLCDGILDEREYLEMKKRYEDDDKKLEGQIEKWKERQQAVSDYYEKLKTGIGMFEKYQGFPEPTREMVETLVKEIKIYEDSSIEIIFKYADPAIAYIHSLEGSDNE